MIRKLMALPCLLALALACGQGRTDDQDAGTAGGAESGALPADTSYTGAGVEDTTAAPSVDAADTAAPATTDSAAAGAAHEGNSDDASH